MTQEDKAKAYDELIKDIKRIIFNHEGCKLYNLLEKQSKQKQEINYPKFIFSDVLTLQCCIETIKKVQEDKVLYEQLQSLHDKLYDAYQFEKQNEEKSQGESAYTSNKSITEFANNYSHIIWEN